jgi:hypothetical protein
MLWGAQKGAVEHKEDLYLQDGGGELKEVGPGEIPALTTVPLLTTSDELLPVGASADLSRTVYTITNEPGSEGLHDTWPGDSTRGKAESLYEYRYEGAASSEPMLVGVKNQAPLAGKPLNEGAELISECGTTLGSTPGGSGYNAISEDGETVFFTARACGGSPPVNELYARVNGARTVAVSQPSKEDCQACDTASEAVKPATFAGASADGQRAFFLTEQALLPGREGMSLYEYDFAAPAATLEHPDGRIGLVSPGAKPEVQGVVRISEDGARVYFVARGVLAGANSEGHAPQAGADNLYLYEPDPAHAGASRVVFVATLLTPTMESEAKAREEAIEAQAQAQAVKFWEARCPPALSNFSCFGEVQAVLQREESALGYFDLVETMREDRAVWRVEDQRPAQATPNGRFLVFPSSAALTPDDSSSVPQLFEYDAQGGPAGEGGLTRVSIGQDASYANDGNVTRFREAPQIPRPAYAFSDLPNARHIGLAVSDDGSRVFFTSAAPLTPLAVSGQPSVFEYREGNVYLISDGEDKSTTAGGESAVQLYGTDPSGADVFFTTADRLVPQAADTQKAIYDAREGGGFPAPSQSQECLGETCRGATGESPSPISFGTLAQAGEGSASPAPAAVSTSRPTAAHAPTPSGRRPARERALAKALEACDRLPRDRRRRCRTRTLRHHGKRAPGVAAARRRHRVRALSRDVAPVAGIDAQAGGRGGSATSGWRGASVGVLARAPAPASAPLAGSLHAVGAPAAHAPAPGPAWSIESKAEPAYFNAAETRDGVRAFTVAATGGTYELSTDGSEEPDALTAPIEWDETAAGLRAKLEAVAQIGPGNVQVSGGPGDEAGGNPYVVTYGGALSGSETALLPRNALLTGGAKRVRADEALEVSAAAHDRFSLAVTNVGAAASAGPVTISDQVPAQLTVTGAEAEQRPSGVIAPCSLAQTVVCEFGEPLPPGGKLTVTVDVGLRSSSFSGSVTNAATVTGGGAAAASTSESAPVNAGPPPFGIERFAMQAGGPDGRPDAQAGDHPYALTTTIGLNTMFTGEGRLTEYAAVQEAKDVSVQLPLGFVAQPLAAPRCPEVKMDEGDLNGKTACPAESIVGEIWLAAQGNPWAYGPYPLYNIAPERGYPAELAFNAAGFGQPIFLYASIVPSATGYRLRVAAPGVLRTLRFDLEGIAVTLFGDPSAHDGGSGHAALVTNPTACTGEPLTARLDVSSWQGGFDSREAVAYPQLEGCDLLQGVSAFSPSVEVRPEQTQADTPSGYEVALKLPQAPDVFGQPATPELRDVSLTLPPGLSLSPSLASGSNSLEACGAAQIDLLGTELGEGHPGGNGSPYDDGMTHASPGHCPPKSQIGDAELKTPLLEKPLLGHLFVATPSCGGVGQPACTSASAQNGELFGLYLELAGSGVIVKLRGAVDADPSSGQLTVDFKDAPQLPFEELRLTIYGGQRAPLANPQACAAASTAARIVPWSVPGTPTAMPSSTPFQVSGCGDPMPFAPRFSAGAAQALAGGPSAFSMQLVRGDGEQDFGAASVTLPSGLVGLTAGVFRCPEPLAAAGACPERSRIGTVRAAAGAGSEPLWLRGPVYLTGPYEGSPFGLVMAIDATAGPFHLGEEVVRARLDVAPRTAEVTVTTDPLRLARYGIPFRLKTLQVTVDRPGFAVNPTHCDRQQVTGSVLGQLPDGSPGAVHPVSSPFAVTGCRGLPFHPSFSVFTQGATGRARGASLDVKVRTPAGSANVREVHVTLPRALPARLQTLKLACVEGVFDANPAACPPASAVGIATARTPILASPVSGPAYLVSHGGAEFPDLEIVLQGEGVQLILQGKTFVRDGITSSTFSTLPDAPVRSFELTLPQGPHSVLGAPGGKLCSADLTMPTTMRGQNGAFLKQDAKIAVSGCGPAIEVLRRDANRTTATIVAAVPAAGTIAAGAPGLSPAVERTRRAGHVTLRLKLTAAERGFLAKHPGRRLQARVKLRFAPRRGRRLIAEVIVLIG